MRYRRALSPSDIATVLTHWQCHNVTEGQVASLVDTQWVITLKRQHVSRRLSGT